MPGTVGAVRAWPISFMEIDVTYLSPKTNCIVSGCGARRGSGTEGTCETHHQKLIECGWQMEGLGFWLRDGEIGYESVHSRIRSMFGNASTKKCAECGKKKASDWAYDHQDSDELMGITKSAALLKFSLDPARYQALCRSCHSKRDNAHRAAALT